MHIQTDTYLYELSIQKVLGRWDPVEGKDKGKDKAGATTEHLREPVTQYNSFRVLNLFPKISTEQQRLVNLFYDKI